MMFFYVKDFLTGDSGSVDEGSSFLERDWLLAEVLSLSSGRRYKEVRYLD